MTDADKICVLIVDDEPLNRELLMRVLQRDYRVLEASDAQEALTVLEKHAADISAILCDQLMPGRFGTELASDVKTRWPKIRFLVLTGMNDAPEIEVGLREGTLARVVSKPWRAEDLKVVLKQVLAG